MSKNLKTGLITGLVLGCIYYISKYVLIAPIKYPMYDDQFRNFVLEDGEIFVWKACKVVKPDGKKSAVYVKLFVPEDAKRVTPYSRGCYKARVEYAVVFEIFDDDGNNYNSATSFVHENKTKHLVYTVGEIVRPDSFNPDPNVDCGAGINVHRHMDHCKIWFRLV